MRLGLEHLSLNDFEVSIPLGRMVVQESEDTSQEAEKVSGPRNKMKGK